MGFFSDFAPIIGAGAGFLVGGPPGAAIGGAIGNQYSQSVTNQQQIGQSERMWNLNNAYNTPAMQRARLIEGGYNPNLFYGNGTTGNSSSPANTPQLKAPQLENVGAGLMLQSDLAIRKAQLQNIQADTANKIASNPLIDANTENRGIDRDVKLATYSDTVEQQKQRRIGMQLDNAMKDISLSNLDDRQKTAINQMRQDIQLKIKQGEAIDTRVLMDNFEIQLNKIGLTKSDPLYARLAKEVADLLIQNK